MTTDTDTVTVIGAGSGGCAGAADLARAGYQVTLYNRSFRRLEPIELLGGIRLVAEGQDHGIQRLAAVTDSIEDAARAATTILVMAPTSALGYYAEQLSEHLTDDHRILLAPGHTAGALYFSKIIADRRPDISPLIGETHTLPFICRMNGPAEVTVWSRAKRLLAASLPGDRIDELMEVFGPLLPSLHPVRSVLETSLSNHNAVMHPAGMILNAGWIERTGGDFRYYTDGHTAAVSAVIEAVDRERREIGARLGVELESFLDAFYAAGATSQEAWQSGSIERAITESAPNREIKAPSSLDDRYVHEDFGYGLVPFLAFAAVAGVSAPVTDALVTLAETATGFTLRKDGLNADKLGLSGMQRDELVSLVGA
ncbi:NAD/NADP octopine/nopaline dehydrogenase family protein [Pseudactinotalea sp.]|uniref:NAD/NADP octopine/nopaline dehydrogenase family protein n=1 Tax=Pseudactinotalea sp. TaxID=1926260 RepID=UPI003B3ADAE7